MTRARVFTALVRAGVVCLALLMGCTPEESRSFTIRLDMDDRGAQVVQCVDNSVKCRAFVAHLCAASTRQRARR